MHAAIRRYEGADKNRSDELIRLVKDEFVPRLKERGDLQAYYVVEEDGVLTTITICDSPEAVDASTRAAAEFIRERGFSDALPNPPQVTGGNVIVHEVSAGAIA
jgi:hypothetical protein